MGFKIDVFTGLAFWKLMATPAFIKTHKAAMLFIQKVSWVSDLTLPYLQLMLFADYTMTNLHIIRITIIMSSAIHRQFSFIMDMLCISAKYSVLKNYRYCKLRSPTIEIPRQYPA